MGRIALNVVLTMGFSAGCTPVVRQTVSTGSPEAIIGGVRVDATDEIARSTVMLIDVPRNSLCSGIVLNTKWILTAAHCVDEAQTQNLAVVLQGSFSDLINGTVKSSDILRVVDIRIHPRYQEVMTAINEMIEQIKAKGKEATFADLDRIRDWADIALVRVDQDLSGRKSLVRFLTSDTPLTQNHSLTVAGYGQSQVSSLATKGDLHKVEVTIFDPSYGSSEVLVNNQERGACHGDSGGPAFSLSDGEYRLAGVASRAVGGSGSCDGFTAYTLILGYRGWIEEMTGLTFHEGSRLFTDAPHLTVR